MGAQLPYKMTWRTWRWNSDLRVFLSTCQQFIWQRKAHPQDHWIPWSRINSLLRMTARQKDDLSMQYTTSRKMTAHFNLEHQDMNLTRQMSRTPSNQTQGWRILTRITTKNRKVSQTLSLARWGRVLDKELIQILHLPVKQPIKTFYSETQTLDCRKVRVR